MGLRVINPYDGSEVAQVPFSTQADVAQAIGRAYGMRETLATMPAYRRAGILSRSAEIIAQQLDDLAQLIARESGKPLRYARGEVSRAVETFTFAADEARRLHGETIPLDAAVGGVGRVGYYVRVPVGVVAAITPFNFPLNLVAHKVAPAIAAGCPLVLKPAPATPLTALRLAAILAEAGLPEGALQVVIGDADVGRWLTSDPRIAMITFTGSPPVARAISQVAGLRRTTFELGGNAAVIVDEDVALNDNLLNKLVVGSFAYSGQVCISVQRIYVHHRLYADFRERFVDQTRRLQSGDPLSPATEIGPLINVAAGERLERWIADAVAQGARILVGGERNGQFFAPTVLENVTEDMTIMCAEAFGPIVNLCPFDDFEQVLAAVDASDFGLQAGIFTPHLAHALHAVERLNVGGVIINDAPTFRVDHMPYGGNKQSGVGREGPRFAIEDMTTLKMVVINPQMP